MNTYLLPPGQPGAPATWTSSRKSGVGTAIGADSEVWFTVAHGIVNEIYYPTMDQANTRDFGFLVVADDGFFSEEKRHTRHKERPIEQGVPGYELINTCEQGRYRISKTVITDPSRNALVMQVRFEVLQGSLSDYRIYALLSPHLGNQGADNSGWVGDHKGTPLLIARRVGVSLAMACSAGWKNRSCGYVGRSDGWQDIKAHQCMTEFYNCAPKGNIALTGEIDLVSCAGQFTISLGFEGQPAAAGYNAKAALFTDFEEMKQAYIDGWQAFQKKCIPLVGPRRDGFDIYRVSTAVLRTHENKRFRGGIIASLSIPWGDCRGDRDLGGYHVVWPRDQVHAALALLAAGQEENARNTLFYLICTQESEGCWPQCMWVDGRIYRDADQQDQTGAFLLLADRLRRERALGSVNALPAVIKAAQYLTEHGPVTGQDRWEENPGYTPYSLAVVISGLLAAADFCEAFGEVSLVRSWRKIADGWNRSIERWLYITGTPLAKEHGVDGYYMRLTPAEADTADKPGDLIVELKNYAGKKGAFKASEVVSPDVLALVRFGLRRADDPRILNTVKVIDATLKRETRSGTAWRRFTYDAYGEAKDGHDFDKESGIGRSWPLLTGERAHYELAKGNRAEAVRLLEAMTRQSHTGGMLPEQIWDDEDIPEAQLFNGQPTGSAMPLVWAHAELVTLVRSLRENRVFDCPPQTLERYANK